MNVQVHLLDATYELFRAHFSRRREYPARLAHLPVTRLRTQAEVDRFLAEAS